MLCFDLHFPDLFLYLKTQTLNNALVFFSSLSLSAGFLKKQTGKMLVYLSIYIFSLRCLTDFFQRWLFGVYCTHTHTHTHTTTHTQTHTYAVAPTHPHTHTHTHTHKHTHTHTRTHGGSQGFHGISPRPFAERKKTAHSQNRLQRGRA